MEENTRKITPWKIIKWTLMLISLLVYLLIFVRLFVSCDADISDDIILLSSEKEDFDDLDKDYPFYNYQPTSWTNDDGTLQLKNIYYLEPISELQLTVRYRISTFDTKERPDPFIFKIRVTEEDGTVSSEKPLYSEDLEGTVFDDLEMYTESRFDYKYIRICCPEIAISDGEQVTRKVQNVDEDGNVSYDVKTETVGGNKVYLDIYDSDSKELLYSFVVAGKTVGGVRTRRSKVDTRIIG